MYVLRQDDYGQRWFCYFIFFSIAIKMKPGDRVVRRCHVAYITRASN